MKTFNVLQFYNGFFCYFKSTCSSFDKVIKLFTLFCLHPLKSYFGIILVIWFIVHLHEVVNNLNHNIPSLPKVWPINPRVKAH
jgi:hypothetical protein